MSYVVKVMIPVMLSNNWMAFNTTKILKENSSSDTQSIQRKSDGTYEVKNLTFRQLNNVATCSFSVFKQAYS